MKNGKRSLVEMFAEGLYQARSRDELSQAQLAARCLLSVPYISMLERGMRSPTLATVERLAGAMGRAPRELFR